MLEHLTPCLDVTTLLIFAIFFLLLGYRPPWWNRRHNDYHKCVTTLPGPLSLPFFGTRWLYTFGGYHLHKIHEFYQDMHLKYGPVMKEEALWNVPVISLFDRRDIEKVLKVGGKYPIRPPTEAIAVYRRSRPDRYVSTGLVNEQGETWQNLRTSLTTDLTSPKTIADFLPEVNEIADDWCNLIKSLRTNNQQIKNLEHLGSRLGLEATCALVLGRRMGFLLPGGESTTAKKLANAVHHHFLSSRDTYYGLPFWKLFATPSYKRLIESEEDIYSLALELVQSADESVKESPIFQSVLHAEVDEREKTAAIVDFIAAGIHTLSNSLLFLLHLIGAHKDVQDTLYKELTETKSNSYLKACVVESFRLLPTAFCLARITEQEMELGGFKVGPGSVVLCHTGIACRDERNFKNADEFRPERWLGKERSETAAVSTYIVAPFGVGRRACPGKRFIEQTLPVILERTVRKFVVRCERPLELQFEFLLAPKAPLEMVFEDRG